MGGDRQHPLGRVGPHPGKLIQENGRKIQGRGRLPSSGNGRSDYLATGPFGALARLAPKKQIARECVEVVPAQQTARM